MQQDLIERIRRLETRLNRLDRQQRPASPADTAGHLGRKSKPQVSDLELEPWPSTFQGMRQVIISLSGRFEEQVDQLEFRIARLERELNIGTGTNSVAGETNLFQMSADIRLLKNQFGNLDQDISNLNGRIDERCQRLSTEMENNVNFTL
ncbi:hypothetical protein FBUS_02458 [Fasciolopsis buskii]|uniref:Uncharacterized protein n=1 Tax=Fasciolopsis buskii TaxID=27845 RepID=A0A8E0S491_9TREM|nr:hypothetical protein FBUS_02458 [Fasciolopsis buski]